MYTQSAEVNDSYIKMWLRSMIINFFIGAKVWKANVIFMFT